METTARQQTRLIPLNQWARHHEWPPLGGLRHLYFNRDTNGFGKVARKVGARVLIDEAAFFQWVDEQNATADIPGVANERG
jgi:hypothetical protein